MAGAIDLAKLREPFPPDRISWRVGSTTADKSRGMALAYIDARDVQDRLDAVCGPSGWQCRYPHANDKKTVCEVGVKIGDEWIWKADGAGDTDFEAEKGALSDAFKRAAVRWGIGRYLYDVDAPWVAIEPAGKSFKIKESEQPKLRSILAGRSVPREEMSEENPKTLATEWARKAEVNLITFATSADLSTWHRTYADKIASIRPLNESAHKRLIDAIHARQTALSPLNAG